MKELRGFNISNGGRYFVVKGEVPLEVAKQLHESAFNRVIRVGGHGLGGPPELPYVTFYDLDDRKVIHDPDGSEEKQWRDLVKRGFLEDDDVVFVPDAYAWPGVTAVVELYHIDTKEGLDFFIKTMKKWRAENRTIRFKVERAWLINRVKEIDVHTMWARFDGWFSYNTTKKECLERLEKVRELIIEELKK